MSSQATRIEEAALLPFVVCAIKRLSPFVPSSLLIFFWPRSGILLDSFLPDFSPLLLSEPGHDQLEPGLGLLPHRPGLRRLTGRIASRLTSSYAEYATAQTIFGVCQQVVLIDPAEARTNRSGLASLFPAFLFLAW